MRRIDLVAVLLAGLGVALAAQAWFAGSLFRYVLAGAVAGGGLCLPLLVILVLRDRGRRLLRRITLALLPLLAVLVVLEIGLRVFGRAVPPPAVLVADARLGHVVQPGTGESDAWGFRNAAVPERADALFIGDSQSWGFFVEREQAYPAVFAAQTGMACYQMANGGYGPVRYRELVRRGLQLRPKLVVVGFYFGNDLWDAYDGAGLVGAEDLRDPRRKYEAPRPPEPGGKASPNWTMASVDLLLERSRLIGWIGDTVKAPLRGQASLLDAQAGAVPFTEAPVATMLLPDYRRPALDLGNEGIADSLRIAEKCLRDIAADCRAAGARCLLLAIPTKEYCYAEWLRGRGAAMSVLAGLYDAETAVRNRLLASAAAAQLELVDLAPTCIDALAAGTPIWAGNGDGHLMVNGHRAAAQAIAAAWSAR
ncbi:MAG: hypothetical protein KDC48_12440 [Planctomycetes bacterium]|nr:hypothetical protein [Planctomycetota bacterium]